MENKAHALITGLFTVALVTAAILLSIWFNQDREVRVPYELATQISVPGLNPQASVRYRGLNVGKVDDIAFDPDVPGQVLVRIGVKPETPITQSTYATLGYQGVTGIAYVELDDDGSRPTLLPSSAEHIARIELRPSLLDDLKTRGIKIMQQTEDLTALLQEFLKLENQREILAVFADMSKTIAATHQVVDKFGTIPTQLGPVLAELPAVVIETRAALATVGKMTEDVGQLTNTLNTMALSLQAHDGPIDNLSEAAEHISSAALRFELDALPLTNDLRTSLAAFNRTLDSLVDSSQNLLFGGPHVLPGPGEKGFNPSN